MSIFSRALSRSADFEATVAAAEKGVAAVTGLGHIHKAAYAHALGERLVRRTLFLAADEAEAYRVCEDLRALGTNAVLYPARELSLRETESASREFEQQRLGVLERLALGEDCCVVACIDAAAQLTLPPEALLEHTLDLVAGRRLTCEDLPAELTRAGYERCEQVEGTGQFAVRGGIVDVYPASCDAPVRIELWGDTVDTLAWFDLTTQRRTESLESLSILPATELLIDDASALADRMETLAGSLGGRAIGKEALLRDATRLRAGGRLPHSDKYLPLIYPKLGSILDYMPEALLLLSEPNKAKERLHAATWQLEQEETQLLEAGELCRGLDRYLLSWSEFCEAFERRGGVLMDTFARTGTEIRVRELINVTARQLPVWSGGTDLLCEDLQALRVQGTACVVLCGAEEKNALVLAEDLNKRNIPALYAPSPAEPTPRHVTVTCGGLSAGMEFPDAKVAFITHGRAITRKKRGRLVGYKGGEIHSLSELQAGDYVVHASHGIGRYQGIHALTVQGVTKDYLKLQYDKGDTLYVPVTQLDLVSKYIGAKEDAPIRLHRLGGQEWQKTKTRVRTAVKDIAKQLIALYAKRMGTAGFAFGPDEEWQYDFERRFEYEETEDQLRCTDEIKSDMERPVPMDRLLCGDVGFGKTEVALRAAFKCVSQSKQCVLLVPTTILALQHYNTLLRRFEGFPVKIEMMSRFRTAKQQEETAARIRRGEVDIVVGTHRLLSKDIRFKDLGLFIVDEEQRFGVAQKERIKEMAPNVDVLTLSATPIPRTLNMAMSGIRDMSIIEEAPQDRRPVQTYVLEHDTAILADAVRRELHRGGQVYYLHNRVEDIERVAAAWQMRIPEARVGFAHGKMTEEQLSEIWRKVMEQEIDLLVCTTIIETGVDVANVNTLIIENADHFGLSQLHQLRGRVGRSSRRAYAYLTFVRGKVLTEVSAKRLEAMREFTEFGAGFRIAMRDMEIRGAGNLLGAQQHGHMEAVGYDLYLRLLSEAVEEQKGARPAEREAECLIDLPIPAHIPEEYIAGQAQRLEAYRRIADIRTHEDSSDVYDELIDRYGEPPEAVQGLVEVALLRSMAADAGIYEVRRQGDTLLLMRHSLDMEMGRRLTLAFPRRVMISAGKKPYFSVRVPEGKTSLDVLREALEVLNAPQEEKE